MELHTARQIIDTLMQGVHPISGECMPPESPYNEPQVIRALIVVSRALDEGAPRAVQATRALPPNAGKPWSASEDEKLDSAFSAGIDIKQLAQEFGRTAFAVESRLVRLGKLPARAGMRVGTQPTLQPTSQAAAQRTV